MNHKPTWTRVCDDTGKRLLGIRWNPNTGKYVAKIQDNRTTRTSIYVGTFDDYLTAALARDKKAIELYGENAVLNFPREAYQ